MNVEEYKAAHPEAFAKIVEQGVKKERDRVGSIMAYNTIDPVAVKAAIESGEALTETQRSEFHVKLMNAGTKANITADANEATTTAATASPEKDEALKLEAFMKDVNLGK